MRNRTEPSTGAGCTISWKNSVRKSFSAFIWYITGCPTADVPYFSRTEIPIALKPEKLADVLVYLREKFPHIDRITTYGRAETLAHWSEEQWKLLRQSGLDRIHSGFESGGSDNVLKMINKGLTQEQQIDGGRKVKAAGIELSVYFMPGIGGAEYERENAEQTAYVVNQIDPDFVRPENFCPEAGFRDVSHETEGRI